MRKAAVFVVAMLVLGLSLGLSACSSGKQTPTIVSLEIKDAVCVISGESKNKALLELDYYVTNNSISRSAERELMPQLALDGNVLDATYDFYADETAVEPADVVHVSIKHELNPNVDHDWELIEAEGASVNGQDLVACIKRELKRYNGK